MTRIMTKKYFQSTGSGPAKQKRKKKNEKEGIIKPVKNCHTNASVLAIM